MWAVSLMFILNGIHTVLTWLVLMSIHIQSYFNKLPIAFKLYPVLGPKLSLEQGMCRQSVDVHDTISAMFHHLTEWHFIL